MSEPVKPALTPEEWKKFLEVVNWYKEKGYDDFLGQASYSMTHADGDDHYVAAAHLYGQPFGFTREDVEIVRACAHGWDPESGEAKRLVSLADRIAALLPPAPTHLTEGQIEQVHDYLKKKYTP